MPSISPSHSSSLPPCLNRSLSACQGWGCAGKMGCSSQVAQIAQYFLLGGTFSRSKVTEWHTGWQLTLCGLGCQTIQMGCLGKKCCLNNNSLFSLGKRNRPKQKCPTEWVQPRATNAKAGAGLSQKTHDTVLPPQKELLQHHPVMPIHITQYTATCFQLGVGFSSPSDQVKVPGIWESIQEPVQNSPIRPSATLSVKANGTELRISPKNALKMSMLALLKEKA